MADASGRNRKTEPSPAGGAAGAWTEDARFADAEKRAPAKVRRLFERLGIASFAAARSLDEETLRALPGFGRKTWKGLCAWLAASSRQAPGGGRRKRELDQATFAQRLALAPPLVRDILSLVAMAMAQRGEAADFSTWEAVRDLNVARVSRIFRLPGVGEKGWAFFERWREKTAAPPRFACGDFSSWNRYVASVLEAMLESAAAEQGRWLLLARVRLGLFSEARPGTLAAAAAKLGVTRQRVEQMETWLARGGTSRKFAGLIANAEDFRDFLRRVEAAFAGGFVLSEAEFRRRLAARLPWKEDCTRRAVRLLYLLGKGGAFEGRNGQEAFVVYEFEARGRAAYEAFLAARGRTDLPESVAAYFRVRARAEKALPAALCGRERRGGRVKQAIVEALDPAGAEGLTLDELERRVRARLGEKRAGVRNYIWREKGQSADLDGKGTRVVVVARGAGPGGRSRYALDRNCPALPAATVAELEDELRRHLEENRIAAAYLGGFLRRWQAEGKVSEAFSDRTLQEALKRKTAGRVAYPAMRRTPGFAMPGTEIPPTNLLAAQAALHFAGRAVVPAKEVVRFAVEGLGCNPATAAASCNACLPRVPGGYLVCRGRKPG